MRARSTPKQWPPPPPPKPKIGDTRPGSPPVTKRRVRKDLVAGSEMALSGPNPVGERPDEASVASLARHRWTGAPPPAAPNRAGGRTGQWRDIEGAGQPG